MRNVRSSLGNSDKGFTSVLSRSFLSRRRKTFSEGMKSMSGGDTLSWTLPLDKTLLRNHSTCTQKKSFPIKIFSSVTLVQLITIRNCL